MLDKVEVDAPIKSSTSQMDMVNSDDQIDLFEQIELEAPKTSSNDFELALSHADALGIIQANPMPQCLKPLAYHFFTCARPGMSFLRFTTDDVKRAFRKLGIKIPKNIADIPYQAQKKPLPVVIQSTASFGSEWILETLGGGVQCFKLVDSNKLHPSADAEERHLEDKAAAIIANFDMSDQARLELQVRENDLLTDFLGREMSFATKPPRGFVKGVGQVDFDAIYVVRDEIDARLMATVQYETRPQPICGHKARRMLRFADIKYPDWKTKAVVVQPLSNSRIAILEVRKCYEGTEVASEVHYVLT